MTEGTQMTKSIEELQADLEEMRPQDAHEDGIPKPDGTYEPDEEDIEDLLIDMQTFVDSLLTVKMSKWIHDECRDISDRLNEINNRHRVH